MKRLGGTTQGIPVRYGRSTVLHISGFLLINNTVSRGRFSRVGLSGLQPCAQHGITVVPYWYQVPVPYGTYSGLLGVLSNTLWGY
jgi:hypothetical protein